MQEQNFEKQVQFTLDELSLTPSAPVWQKVEKEIRQKKERRRVVAFWLFALLLIGGGAFWALYSTNFLSHTPATAHRPDTNYLAKPTAPSSPDAMSPMTPSDANESVTPAIAKTQPSKTSDNLTTKETATTSLFPTTSIKEKQAPAATMPATKSKLKQNDIAQTAKAKPTKVKQQRKATTPAPGVDEPAVARHNNTETKQEYNKIGQLPVPAQSPDLATTSSIAEEVEVKQAEPLPTQDSIPTKKEQKKIRKWSFGAQAGYGVTVLQKDLLEEAFSGPVSLSDPQGNAGFPTTPALNNAALIEKGPSFHLAMTAKRNSQ